MKSNPQVLVQETVSLPLIKKKVVPDSWEIFVSSYRLVISWPNKPVLCIDLVCPPTVLTTPSAEEIMSAFWEHPLLSKITTTVQKIRSHAPWRVHTNEFDGASGNDRFHAASRSLDDCMYEYHLCANHGQHLRCF